MTQDFISFEDLLFKKQLEIEFNAYVLNEKRRRRNHLTRSEPYLSEISKAIKNRQYVGIYYEDESNSVLSGFRLIEPLVYGSGYKMKDKTLYPNRNYLRAFVIRDTAVESNFQDSWLQRKSVSKSKKIPYFRLFRVDRISSWIVFPKKFSHYRELYSPNDKTISNIKTNLELDDFPRGEKQIRLTRALRNKVNQQNASLG